MLQKKVKEFWDILKKIKWGPLKNLFLFFFIFGLFHLVWDISEMKFDFYPIGGIVFKVMIFFVNVTISELVWILEKIFKLQADVVDSVIYVDKSMPVSIALYCSGVKQMVMIAVILFFSKGPILRKIWYIPLSVLIIHCVNVFRILLIILLARIDPKYGIFLHNNVTSLIIYGALFLLWILWVDKLSSPKKVVA